MSLAGNQKSGFPMHEITVNLQPGRCTLFWMELCRKDIITRHCATKCGTVLGDPNRVRRYRRHRVKTMHKIKITVVGNTVPKRMRDLLVHAIPAHLRHLEARTVGLHLAVECEAHDLAGQQAESGDTAF